MTDIATDRMDIYYQQVDKLIVWGQWRCKERHVCSRSSSVKGVPTTITAAHIPSEG